jgi:hypothetical protein
LGICPSEIGVQYQPDGRLSTFPKNTATFTGKLLIVPHTAPRAPVCQQARPWACGLRATPKAKKASTPKRPLFGRGTVLKTVPGGTPMIDPSSKLGRELKAAEDFFELAKNASSPFLQAYYRRVAERYLSSQGDLKPVKRGSEADAANLLEIGA